VRVDKSALGLSWFQLSQWLQATHCVCAARCLHRIFAFHFQPCLAIPLLTPHCVCAARRPRVVALDGIAALPVAGWQKPPGLHQVSIQVEILPSCPDAPPLWCRCTALAMHSSQAGNASGALRCTLVHFDALSCTQLHSGALTRADALVCTRGFE
jgi:hypothetical protein